MLVTADPFTVGWLTGFAADALWGPSPFAVPPIAVVSADGVILLCSTDEEPGVDAARATVVAYEGFTTDPLDPAAGQVAALAGLGLAGRIAVEGRACRWPPRRCSATRRTSAAPCAACAP